LLLGYARPVHACTGDCNADGAVTIDELINGVNILLGSMPSPRKAGASAPF
jgi:hypothetical protein